jgi:hypothetical protein
MSFTNSKILYNLQDGVTCFRLACANGMVEIVKYLCENEEGEFLWSTKRIEV